MQTVLSAITQALTVPEENKSVAVMRSKIMALEAAIKSHPESLTAKDFETNHHFGPGVYMRELVIPKDMIVTGRIHKSAHLNILSKGQITVWTEEGMKTLTAPMIIKSDAGMKRVGYTHEDSIWITVHHNPEDEADLDAIESRLFADSFEEAYLASGRTFEDAVKYLCVEDESSWRNLEIKEDKICQQ